MSPTPLCDFRLVYTDTSAVVKKEWSLSEWLSAFLEAEFAGWEIDPDDLDDTTMPGGDADYGYDDLDSEILDALIILGLTGALAFLLYYRTQRQRRQEEERRRQQLQQAALGQPGVQLPPQAPPQPPQGNGGMFPNPNDPMNWAGGGLGL